jgi:hypothetical protein
MTYFPTPVLGIYDRDSPVKDTVANELKLAIKQIDGLEVRELETHQEIEAIAKEENISLFFLVHLNRQTPQYNDELHVIDDIKNGHPNALVIAYSAYKDTIVEADCKKRNILFIELTDLDWDKIIFALKMRMKEHFEAAAYSLASYTGTILDINHQEGIVLTELLEEGSNEEDTFEKIFRLSRFDNIPDLEVNMPIALNIYPGYKKGELDAVFKALPYERQPELDWSNLKGFNFRVKNTPLKRPK